jgi:gluconokinase
MSGVTLDPATIRPVIAVVMGVSGTGKSTIAGLLAADLGWPSAEGDDFHSAANVAKMHAGHPLTDADRLPWLQAIAAWITTREAAGTGGIVTCSALKRSYRDLLRTGNSDVRFICLVAGHDTLQQRMEHRPGHFMPASLLKSQLDTLEPLAADEPGATIDSTRAPAEVEAAALAVLSG